VTRPYIHPTALVDSDAIGEGTRIWAYAQVMHHAQIGANCNIGSHAFIENGARIGNNVTLKNHVCVWQGVTIEDDVFVGPMVAFTNDVRPRSPRMAVVHERYSDPRNWLVPTVVQQGASLGANATILAGVRIGRYSMIGAGATVTKDVEPFALMVGCPARRVGYVCRCGQKLNGISTESTCAQCGTSLDLFADLLTAGTLLHDRTLP
jgi:acetyltransferase-like isoleucine patch superfamily enzyme